MSYYEGVYKRTDKYNGSHDLFKLKGTEGHRAGDYAARWEIDILIGVIEKAKETLPEGAEVYCRSCIERLSVWEFPYGDIDRVLGGAREYSQFELAVNLYGVYAFFGRAAPRNFKDLPTGEGTPWGLYSQPGVGGGM